MSGSVVVRSDSGVLLEMDVPESGHGRERFDDAVAAGRLTVVETPVEWVERPDGSRHLVDAKPVEVEASKRGRKPAEPTPVPVDD